MYKKGQKVWICSIVKSSGCILSEHLPPTEIILSQDCKTKSEITNYYNLKSADWQGQKMKIGGWSKCAFDTEAEALNYYHKN